MRVFIFSHHSYTSPKLEGSNLRIIDIPYRSFPELSEDWSSVREPVIEGVPFYVKYLGSSLVQKASGEEATADAIKTIVTMVSD